MVFQYLIPYIIGIPYNNSNVSLSLHRCQVTLPKRCANGNEKPGHPTATAVQVVLPGRGKARTGKPSDLKSPCFIGKSPNSMAMFSFNNHVKLPKGRAVRGKQDKTLNSRIDIRYKGKGTSPKKYVKNRECLIVLINRSWNPNQSIFLNGTSTAWFPKFRWWKSHALFWAASLRRAGSWGLRFHPGGTAVRASAAPFPGPVPLVTRKNLEQHHQFEKM